MKTELKESLETGFFLSEVELLRIKDAQNEQIKKISGNDANFVFEVKYKNGVIAQPLSIDEILAEENDGSKRIVSLRMEAQSAQNSQNKIDITFSDPSESSERDSHSIRYTVSSDDKDWTFVTLSTINERLSKIRKRWLVNVFSKDLFFPIQAIAMLGIISYPIFSASDRANEKVEAIKSIKSTSKNIEEYIYRIDLMQADSRYDFRGVDQSQLTYLFIAMIILLIVLFVGSRLFMWYPRYTFYWGDNIKRYDRKIGVAKFVASGIILAIVIGIVGNVISSKLL